MCFLVFNDLSFVDVMQKYFFLNKLNQKIKIIQLSIDFSLIIQHEDTYDFSSNLNIYLSFKVVSFLLLKK